MESKSTSGGGGGVIRREGTRSTRYDPYAVTENKYNQMREGVVQLGVEVSLCVAESMFLMCDDAKNMLLFCYMICRNIRSERLIRVMHHVYFDEIISKNRLKDKIYFGSAHCGVIGSVWEDLTYAISILHKLAGFLSGKSFPSGHHRLLSTMDTAAVKRQLMKKVEDKLRCAKDASQANGFARETLEPTISEMWKSLFNEEGFGEDTATKTRLLCDLFQPLFGKSWQPNGGPSKSPKESLLPLYTIGKDFEKQEELREEVVRLGVELSLCVAETMFLMCDDIRSVLLFCHRLWGVVEKDLKPHHDSPVIERLLRVFHYVYSKHIKPKNGGVVHNAGTSVQWKLVMSSFEDFHAGIRDLHVYVRDGSQEFTSTSINEALKNIKRKLRRAKPVSKANGFERKAMESDILVMWKTLFDEPRMDLFALRMMRNGIIIDLFHNLN